MIKEILSDKDLVNTAINQLYRLVSGPLMLLFIPLYLTQEEQGYWYTFGSVAALAVFADLGFSNIILQFAAHEFAFLKFKEDGTIYGDEVHLHKLADFFRFSVKWLCKVTLVVFPIIVVAGYIFINQKNNENINWIIPWFIYSISSALVFVNSSLLSFFEGCNSVAKVQGIRFKISVFTSLTVLGGLFFKIKLFALALSLMVSALLGSFLIYKNYKSLIIQLWKISNVMFYSWKEEFLSLIWRYALSWISGYFTLQIFVPLSFKYYGSIEAGKIGLSLAVSNAFFFIASTFLNSKIPFLNILVAKFAIFEVDDLLKQTLKRSIMIFLLLNFSFFIFYILCENFILIKRLSSLFLIITLMIAQLFRLMGGIIIAYIRAHKKESTVWLAILNSIFVVFFTIYILKNYSFEYLFLGLMIGNFIVLPAELYLFLLQRKLDYKLYKKI